VTAAVGSKPHQRAFWAVAFAFLAVMAFSTVPSPLYGLYRERDHFSVFMVTVIYAVYALGVIGALLLAGQLSDWYGRRRLLLPALGIAIVSAIVFVASKSLTGLIVARLINGISVGIVAATATAYLSELHAIGRPEATPMRAQLTASAVNVGGLGVGALVAGVLAQWVADPLTVPYLVFLAALLVGAVGVALAPETHEGPKPRPRYRPQRLSVPHDARRQFVAAALSAFMAFAAQGLFTGLAGLTAGRLRRAMGVEDDGAEDSVAREEALYNDKADELSRSYMLGSALSLWLNQPNVGFKPKRSTLGFASNPDAGFIVGSRCTASRRTFRSTSRPSPG